MGQPLLEWISASLPGAPATLREPASQEAIAGAAEALGHPLPAALAALYRAHDGQEQTRMRACVFESFRWLPLAECLAQRALYAQVADDVHREYPEAPPWKAAWLPFAVDDLGNAWVVDLVSGRVFELDHAEGEGAPLGDSFEAFLAGYVESFASGERVVDAELGAMRAPAPAVPRTAPRASSRRRAVVLIVIAAYVLALVTFIVWLEMRRG